MILTQNIPNVCSVCLWCAQQRSAAIRETLLFCLFVVCSFLDNDCVIACNLWLAAASMLFLESSSAWRAPCCFLVLETKMLLFCFVRTKKNSPEVWRNLSTSSQTHMPQNGPQMRPAVLPHCDAYRRTCPANTSPVLTGPCAICETLFFVCLWCAQQRSCIHIYMNVYIYIYIYTYTYIYIYIYTHTHTHT